MEAIKKIKNIRPLCELQFSHSMTMEIGTQKYDKLALGKNLFCFKSQQKKNLKTFAEELSYTLSKNNKSIHPKFFYDDSGSKLFEEICTLPEYYVTRTEIEILENIQNILPDFLKGDYRLVELGSGSSTKTRLILDVLEKHQKHVEYFPIDISDILKNSAKRLQKEYRSLSITGIIDTYESGLEFVKNYDDSKNLIAFLGSSFGNFEPKDGQIFLKKIHSCMKDDDLFLIGLDLQKDKQVLEDAYDDSRGITAEFNLNVLKRINSDLGADFDLEQFEHFARYNETDGRIEMHVKSLSRQHVKIPGANLSLLLAKDELIHTEHSHKFSIDQIHKMTKNTGFDVKQMWFDKKNYFTLVLLSKSHAS